MTSLEIFQNASPSTITSMLQYFREEQREIYKQAIVSLASTKNLRAVFVTRKPVPQQIEWMAKTLKFKTSGAIGEHLLQVWLMESQKGLLSAFCEGVGISHDDGSVEGELPETIDATKAKSTIDELTEKFEPEIVAIYLHAFNAQRSGGWASLNELFENNEKLKLG